MKTNRHILYTLTALSLLAIGIWSAQAQEIGTYTLEELKEFFYSEKELPAGGLGNNPSIATLREYYSVSGFHMQPYDKYNPIWCGAASAVVPGFGQIICGKPMRGILFFAGVAAPVTAAVLTYKPPYTNEYGMTEHDITHTVALVATALVAWGWNVIDAAEVAILRDRYNRDVMKSHGAELSLNPCVGVAPGTTNPYAGLSLSLNF